MWTWIVSSKIGRNCVMAVAILALVSLGVRWYSNRQYNLGVKAGQIEATERVLRDKTAEWAAREADLMAREVESKSKLADLIEASNAVNKSREKLMRDFNATIQELSDEKDRAYQYAGGIPDAKLISELRAISGELARAGRTTANAGAVVRAESRAE